WLHEPDDLYVEPHTGYGRQYRSAQQTIEQEPARNPPHARYPDQRHVDSAFRPRTSILEQRTELDHARGRRMAVRWNCQLDLRRTIDHHSRRQPARRKQPVSGYRRELS